MQKFIELIQGLRPRKYSEDNVIQGDFSAGFEEAKKMIIRLLKNNDFNR